MSGLSRVWGALWIGPVEGDDVPDRQRPAYQLGGPATIDGEIAGATLYATAHGIYEAFVNGDRVGDMELTPGYTAYRKRLQVHAYDVTDLLQPGENVIGALLSDGWWRGQNNAFRRVDDYGTTTALLLCLDVTLATGGTVSFGSSEQWRSTPSHILRADLIAGEVHDLRRRAAWSAWTTWDPVRVDSHGYAELVTPIGPPVRRIEDLRPASVTELAPRQWVIDVGQNINGWVRLHHLGPAGNTITLTYGEWLDEAGDVIQDNVAFAPGVELDRTLPFQVDVVTSDGGDGEIFEPRHSTKGFQFVRIEGLDVLTLDDVTAVVVHSDLQRVGSFGCSDERINKLHSIAEWSFRDNACGIPTDCPTRERAGWTGDWQIFVETAAFLYDVHGFSLSWLRDLAAEQRRDGKVTNLVPEPHPSDDRPPDYWPHLEGSAGWGDAAVHVPWTLYRVYGDAHVLAEQYDSMRAWVDFAARAAATGRHPLRVERSADPAPHERYIWDTGWHFGEWLEAGESVDELGAGVAVDHGPVATAYLHRSARQLAETARILGYDHDAALYADLAAVVADAWRIEFLGDDGRTTPDTQATYARALTFGLIPDDLRAPAATRLVELIRLADNHLSTGFLATPFLLPVLADNGHLDVAYDLLFQDTEPSWLVMVDRGATTVWEEWSGVDANDRPHASLNHYSKGAVIKFLHEFVAGIQPIEPGYRRFRVAPSPGGGIAWAEATHETPYGRVAVQWKLTGDGIELILTVPPGTTADVILPGKTTIPVGPGEHRLT